MNAQYYFSPGAKEWAAFIATTQLDSLQRLQLSVLHLERIWIDEQAGVWQVDYSAVAPIVEDTLKAVGDELAAAFSVQKITWKCLNQLKHPLPVNTSHQEKVEKNHVKPTQIPATTVSPIVDKPKAETVPLKSH